MRKTTLIYIWSIVFAVCFCLQLQAQQIPLNQQVQNRLNELFIEADSSVFTGFRGMNWLELKPLNVLHKTQVIDSVFGLNASALNNLNKSNWIKTLRNNNNAFSIDPYIEAGIATSSEKNNALTNLSGGIRLQGVLNDKFSINFDVITNLNQYPLYVDSFIFTKNNIIPGDNAATLKTNNRFAYTNFNFNLTFTPSKYFLISAGYGKQFLGDGYRSLLLSDNANNYPYVRLQARLWKLTYNVLYNRYVNKFWYLVDGESQPKYSTIHYLGFSTKKFQIGLFDNITWLAKDSNFQRGFDVQYLNPLIFMRPLEFGIGSPDNAMIGFNVKYSLYKNGFLYGQLALDDINIKASLDSNAQNYANKYALQLGIWNKDIFNIKGLSYRFEWNGVRPYTYGHGVGNNISLNYTHYYQSLTDPFGANFHEFISLFNYTNQRWYGVLENLITIRGENSRLAYNNGEDLWGGEKNVPQFGSKTLQGNKTTYLYNQLTAGYLINTANRLSIEANVVYRKRTSSAINQSEWYYGLGIKTNIYNFYRDF